TLLVGATAAVPFALVAGCSSEDPGAIHPGSPFSSPTSTATHPVATTPMPTTTGTMMPTPMTKDETWTDGKQITAAIQIMPGVTVTIAPGAKVTVADGVAITVSGTLTGTSTTTHAQLFGNAWTGVTVATGGTLTLSGVDITGSQTGLHVQTGATLATYDTG